ncbi:T9SS type A sorting domain-containing protein [Pontibacter qinzhouensis]|uniref:T9SS type A sorting domain-containing protein n=1 Tax=Pontibacter qinzhouensis TaxID=2603253 RepID=A0A5C8JKF4_9BACT|nr:IPT/TIG domain-containing protein [Pontibacter qinzhouensis]TXK37164.1 T9SS type A sorting domain-containing protein [Pontibacter qinzhouensis]
MTNFYFRIPPDKRNYLPFIFLVFILLSFRSLANDSHHFIPLPLNDRIKGASAIVEGEVVAQQSFWDDAQHNIYTSNTIKVYKVFKGQVQEEQIELITEGGQVGFKIHVFSAALKLKKGQQGIFFLTGEQPLGTTPGKQRLKTRAFGSEQGFIHYDLKQGTAKDVFYRYNSAPELYNSITVATGTSFRELTENVKLREAAAPQQLREQQILLTPVIASFSPAEASAGTATILTINGSDFGSSRGNGSVEFRNADDGGNTWIKPLPRDYISWSNTQIRVQIPSYGEDGGTAGTGQVRVNAPDGSIATSTDSLSIPFVYSNLAFDGGARSFKPVLSNLNNLGGYTMQFGPGMQSRAAAQEAFRRSMNSWICNTQVNWRIGSNTTIATAADDDVSMINFVPGATVGQNVLASTVSRYEGCRSGNDTLLWVSEFDMQINSAINWQFGPGGPARGQYDFETVMLHELGHAHQLGHVILPRAVMHHAVESQALYRDLSNDDITGANFVMDRSLIANICQQPPMLPSNSQDCNFPAENNLLAYPNPIIPENETLNLQFLVDEDTSLTLFLYDYTGKLVKEFTAEFSSLNAPVEVRLHSLAAGMYILRWTHADRSGEVKVMKL